MNRFIVLLLCVAVIMGLLLAGCQKPAAPNKPTASIKAEESGGYGEESGGYDEESGGYGEESGGYGEESGGYSE